LDEGTKKQRTKGRPSQCRFLVVENDVEKRTVNLQATATGIVDEA
jgi:hypothetical protein